MLDVASSRLCCCQEFLSRLDSIEIFEVIEVLALEGGIAPVKENDTLLSSQ